MRRISFAELAERWLLPLIISGLILADGALHLRLDFLLFHGTVWGKPAFHGGGPAGGPPPGSGPAAAHPGPPPGAHMPSMPFPFSLNEMFFLNFLSAIALVLAFWVFYRWFRRWLWLVDLGMLGFAAYSIWGWVQVGKPNPQQLGYITKGLESALIVIVLIHGWLLVRHYVLPRFAPPRPSLHSPAR